MITFVLTNGKLVECPEGEQVGLHPANHELLMSCYRGSGEDAQMPATFVKEHVAGWFKPYDGSGGTEVKVVMVSGKELFFEHVHGFSVEGRRGERKDLVFRATEVQTELARFNLGDVAAFYSTDFNSLIPEIKPSLGFKLS